MDKKEIIRRLKRMSEHAVYMPGRPPFIMSLDDGLAAAEAAILLQEQEPKPIAYTDNPYTGLPVARCPKCGKFARQFHACTDEETHYCPWCGQAVEWNG